MNDAHFHLAVNHLPIVGIMIGLLVLIAGLLTKKIDIKLTAFGIFIFSAVTAAIANYTGEGAEEIVEDMVGISETLIHTHEEQAETFLIFTTILGILSVIGLFAELKKFAYARYITVLILLTAVAAGVIAKFVGTSGGEIRHIEIRATDNLIPVDKRQNK